MAVIGVFTGAYIAVNIITTAPITPIATTVITIAIGTTGTITIIVVSIITTIAIGKK